MSHLLPLQKCLRLNEKGSSRSCSNVISSPTYVKGMKGASSRYIGYMSQLAAEVRRFAVRIWVLGGLFQFFVFFFRQRTRLIFVILARHLQHRY